MRFAAALTRHELPGASHNSRAERIDKPLAADIAQALAAIGVRKRKGKLHAGAYELGALLDNGTFQAGGTSEELMTDAVLGPSLGAYTRQVALYAEGIRRATGDPAEAALLWI